MQKMFVPFAALLLLLFLIIGGSFLHSCKCSKTVPCPGYTDTLLDAWFPYHDKQLLVFKSSVNTSDSIDLKMVDSTLPYEYSTGGFENRVTGCSASKSFKASRADSNGNNHYVNITLYTSQADYSSDVTRSVSISLLNNSFTGSGLTGTGFTVFTGPNSANGIPETFKNFTYNGKIYPLLQFITFDSTICKNETCIYKLIIAKNKGIIAYETNPGGITWIKQE